MSLAEWLKEQDEEDQTLLTSCAYCAQVFEMFRRSVKSRVDMDVCSPDGYTGSHGKGRYSDVQGALDEAPVSLHL